MNDDRNEPSRAGTRFLRWATIVAVVVLCLGYIRALAPYLGVSEVALGGRLFNLNAEHNLPAWFSALLLLSVAVAMLRTSYVEFALKLGTAWGWLLLGLGFVYLAIDEQVGLHERFGRSADGGNGIAQFTWVAYAIPGLIVIALVFIPFLRQIPSLTAIRLLTAGGMFVLGSVGLEIVGGWIMVFEGRSLLYTLETTLEETLEIGGVLLALRSVLLHRGHLRERTPTPASA